MSNRIRLDLLTPEDGYSQLNRKENVFEVYTPHVLIQIIGYIKYAYKDGPVLFRGQGKNYPQMKPGLFRDIKNITPVSSRIDSTYKYIDQLYKKKAFLTNTPAIAYEPLLQHYGIKTTWLDLVDNIWTALWFASHSAKVAGPSGKYVHYEINNGIYSYISILYFGKMLNTKSSHTEEKIKLIFDRYNQQYSPESTSQPWFIETDTYRIIDLRYATPSLYKRPHAQHGLLAQRTRFSSDSDIDYSDAKVCTLKIATKSVLEWLGNGSLSSTHFMFPPPKYDSGYEKFLTRGIDPPSPMLGSIQIIGA